MERLGRGVVDLAMLSWSKWRDIHEEMTERQAEVLMWTEGDHSGVESTMVVESSFVDVITERWV